jgi:hypothetical protein
VLLRPLTFDTLEHGAGFAWKDAPSTSPYAYIVYLLLLHGADVCMADAYGLTPFDYLDRWTTLVCLRCFCDFTLVLFVWLGGFAVVVEGL